MDSQLLPGTLIPNTIRRWNLSKSRLRQSHQPQEMTMMGAMARAKTPTTVLKARLPQTEKAEVNPS